MNDECMHWNFFYDWLHCCFPTNVQHLHPYFFTIIIIFPLMTRRRWQFNDAPWKCSLHFVSPSLKYWISKSQPSPPPILATGCISLSFFIASHVKPTTTTTWFTTNYINAMKRMTSIRTWIHFCRDQCFWCKCKK